MSQFSPTRIIEGVGGNGVLFVFDFGEGGKTIMLRCELDALPIHEYGRLKHMSRNPGVSHKCGHDGHMAIVARSASRLWGLDVVGGRVILLFQPAEETGTGARQVLDDRAFAEFSPDHIIALHNLPGFELNSIVLKPGLFNAEVISVIIELRGRISHASEPEKGINPAIAVAELIQALQELQEQTDDGAMRLLTPIQIELGEEAFGVSAGKAVVKYTLRTWTPEALEILKAEVTALVDKMVAKTDLACTVDWVQHFSACYNSPGLIRVIGESARELGLNVIEVKEPFRFGEDFGLFTQRFNGAMFGLGAGIDSPPLHSEAYDFPDELIESGASVLVSVVQALFSDS